MSISGLSTNQAATMGLIQGTGITQTESVGDVLAQGQSAAQAQTATDTLDLGQGTQTLASPAAMSMIQLQRLAASDPTRFKAVTLSISDQLAAEGKSATNLQEGKFLDNLSDKFAEASKSGGMAALDFHKGNEQNLGNASSALSKYNGQGISGLSGVFSQVAGVISGALSSAGVSSAAATPAAGTAVAGVSASGSTAA